MLTKHVEKWKKYKKKNDRSARGELICEFVPLVHYVFGRMSIYLPRILDDQDLIAAGMIGLISAVNDFDITRGIEFTTFAVPRIRGAILDELREHDWVPRTARRRAAELDAAMNKSRENQYSEADFGKVARLMGVARSDLSKLISKARPAAFVPIDQSHDTGNHDNMSIGQLLADQRSSDPGNEAEHSDQCKALMEALQKLPEIERSVITQYYFQQRMQKDIAKDLRVSRSRVSQIHNHAVNALRERMTPAGAA